MSLRRGANSKRGAYLKLGANSSIYGIWIHVLCVSTNQNAYVTKTFWIRHESGNFIAIVKVVYFYPFYKRLVSPPGGGRGTPKKIDWGCAARFPKPLPYL